MHGIEHQDSISQKNLRLRLILSHEKISILTINLSLKFFCEINSSIPNINDLSMNLNWRLYGGQDVSFKKSKTFSLLHDIYCSWGNSKIIKIEYSPLKSSSSICMVVVMLTTGILRPPFCWFCWGTLCNFLAFLLFFVDCSSLGPEDYGY